MRRRDIVSKYEILDKIGSPSDLRELSDEELDTLASEIRRFLVDNVSRTGGHLASKSLTLFVRAVDCRVSRNAMRASTIVSEPVTAQHLFLRRSDLPRLTGLKVRTYIL